MKIKKMRFFAAVLFWVLLSPSVCLAAGTLYLVEDATDTFWAVNTTNADITRVGNAGTMVWMEGLAVSPDSDLFYGSNGDYDLFEIDIYRSAAKDISDFRRFDVDEGLAYNTVTGTLYGVGNDGIGIIDPATGDISIINDTDACALAVDSINNILYLVTADNSELLQYNITTNTLINLGDMGIADDGDNAGMAYDPTENILYFIDESGNLYRISPPASAATYIGNVDIMSRDNAGLAFVPILCDPTAGKINIKGLTVSGTREIDSEVTFTIGAENSCSDTINYRFSVHPDYGTSGYTGLNWQSMTDTEWVSNNSIDYTFSEKGKHIVVVWVTEDSNNISPNGIPITGWSVDISDDLCKTDITGYSATGTQQVNSTLTLTVNAENECSNNLYYRFSVHPDYGTDGYDGTKWESMTNTEWVQTNSIDYSFTQVGKYIIVVWVSDTNQNVDPTGIPIIGWSVDIE